ncbi:MAG: hypothetical protein ABEI54_03120, partial [Candidatus Bipolaricaulia bacterium]
QTTTGSDVDIYKAVLESQDIGEKAYPYFPNIYPNRPAPSKIGFDKIIVDRAYVKTIQAFDTNTSNSFDLKVDGTTVVTHGTTPTQTQGAITSAALDTVLDKNEAQVAYQNAVQPSNAGEIEYFVSLMGI